MSGVSGQSSIRTWRSRPDTWAAHGQFSGRQRSSGMLPQSCLSLQANQFMPCSFRSWLSHSLSRMHAGSKLNWFW